MNNCSGFRFQMWRQIFTMSYLLSMIHTFLVKRMSTAGCRRNVFSFSLLPFEGYLLPCPFYKSLLTVCRGKRVLFVGKGLYPKAISLLYITYVCQISLWLFDCTIIIRFCNNHCFCTYIAFCFITSGCIGHIYFITLLRNVSFMSFVSEVKKHICGQDLIF